MDTFSPQSNVIPTLQAAKDFQAFNYVSFAALALIIYDTALMIPHSIDYIKSRRLNIVVALYICAQFGTLSSLTFTAFQNAALPHFISAGACNGLRFAQDLCSGFAAIGIQGLLLGRAYAIAPHNKKSMILLGSIYVVIVGSAFGLFHWWKCDTLHGNAVVITSAAIEVSLVIFDIGVLVITLYHAWAIRGVSRTFTLQSEHTPRSLTDLFIRQGVFRFMLIAAWSTADAFVYKFARPSITGIDEPLEVAISPIILSRFLFQLRKTYAESDEPSNQGELTTFQAAVRSIGTNIRMELGDNDITEPDNIRHPSPGNPSLDDLENLGHYAGGGDNDNIPQRFEEP